MITLAIVCNTSSLDDLVAFTIASENKRYEVRLKFSMGKSNFDIKNLLNNLLNNLARESTQ